jgi:protein-tyrosine kinase
MQTKTFTETIMDNRVIQNAYSILMGNVYLLGKENEFKTFAITSCNPREGKTSLSTALAITMAGMGKKTLLVDLDLRKTHTMKQSGQPNVYGISHYLKGDIDLNDALCKTNIENFVFLDSGKITGNPMSLLCSEKLNLFISDARKQYDYVLFDTPSLECITDAIIISTKVDATILVAKMGHTTIVEIKKVKEQLDKVNANLLGIVLNKTGKRSYKKNFNSYNFFDKERSTAKTLA